MNNTDKNVNFAHLELFPPELFSTLQMHGNTNSVFNVI